MGSAWYWNVVYFGAASAAILLLRRLVLYGSRCQSKALMVGKTVIITGANCGIGKATALDLARRQARVILACRNEESAQSAVKDIRRYTSNGELVVKKLDLASLKSVRTFCEDIAKEESRVDVLINNAGVANCPYTKTEDGLETHLAVNHVGNFLLTNLLLDKLKSSKPSRIVFVSSSLHKYGRVNFEEMNSHEQYKKGKPYADTKLANVLFARELHDRLEGSGVCVYTVHPGIVRTSLGRYMIPGWLYTLFCPLFLMVAQTPTEGSQTVIYCAVAPELEDVSGNYYGKCKQEPWSHAASDEGTRKKIWEWSEKLAGLI
ncbi:hypothetical protein ACJMK2_037553 [Sinanodonta woodiana]|uniref:Retinol dehydrogenase 11 n=1 Tax=Sinanodonta woodiana TaxID=1069815 RepID=A0ABD3WMW8_SINWO